MRGLDEQNGSLFSYVSLDERIPARHPARKVVVIVNDVLQALDSGCFARRWCRSCLGALRAPADGADAVQSAAEPSTTRETTPMSTTTETSKDRNAEVDFRGQKRCNETHQSVTDPQARLYRKGKGKPAPHCFAGHPLMENRSGLIVDVELTQGMDTPSAAAIAMIERHSPGSERRLTLGADKGYYSADFSPTAPHVRDAARGREGQGLGHRWAHHAPCGLRGEPTQAQRIEEPFGWGKTVGGLRESMLRGLARAGA
jgi:hypothetical protein